MSGCGCVDEGEESGCVPLDLGCDGGEGCHSHDGEGCDCAAGCIQE